MKLSNKLAMQNSGFYSVEHFHNRLTRWGRLRVATVPTLLFLEPVSECILQGLCSKTVSVKPFILLFIIIYLFIYIR